MTDAAYRILLAHLLEALKTPPAQETRRLFHGRGKCWPGLEQITVDWLSGVVLVMLFREPEGDIEALLRELIASDTFAASGARGLLLQQRYLPGAPSHWLYGEAPSPWHIQEHGLTYLLDLGGKQNSGLFLDMRLGRQWVREHTAGKRVLNLFAYTCGFSVAAIAGGASTVVNLDMARAALSRGRDNHRANDHDLARVEFLGHELFKSWGRVKRSGPYDLVIIDPPSFQKGSFVLTQDYRKVLRRLPELLNPGAQVLACVNDPEIGPEFLLEAMGDEAPQLVFVERLANPPEFPDIDPSSGLKALLFTLQGQSGN